jgi:hypothetical protein
MLMDVVKVKLLFCCISFAFFILMYIFFHFDVHLFLF